MNDWELIDSLDRASYSHRGWGGVGAVVGREGISPSLDFITNLFQHVTTSQPIRSSGHGSQGPKFMGSIYP